MRPASEINSALELVKADSARHSEPAAMQNLSIARDILAWVMGDDAPIDGANAWLVAYLLDDPPKLESYDPQGN